jgi:hypothetical protein
LAAGAGPVLQTSTLCNFPDPGHLSRVAALKDSGALLPAREEPNMGGTLRHDTDISTQVVRYWQQVKDMSVPSFTLFPQEDIGVQKFLDRELQKNDRLMGQISAVYVPPAVKAADKVNVILFLHGDKVRINHSDFTIREYLNLKEMPLRQGLNTSGQPFVLVAPTLGADADTEFGDLGDKIDDYLEHMMTQLYELGAPEFDVPSPPKVGELIIAGHSGGFGPIRSILSKIRRYKDHLKEIWGFDIMYGNTATHLVSAKVPVYAYYSAKDTTANSQELAKKRLPNIFVMVGGEFYIERGKEQIRKVPHDNLMQRFWLDRCKRMGTNGGNPEDQKLMVD